MGLFDDSCLKDGTAGSSLGLLVNHRALMDWSTIWRIHTLAFGHF